MADKFVHLTNVCLQQHNSAYGKYEEGNCVDTQALEGYVNTLYP